MPTDISNSLYNIWGSSGSDVFAVGSDGMILHYAGSEWTDILPNYLSENFRGVWGSSASDLFAAGGDANSDTDPAIFRYDGTRWTQMTLPKQYDFKYFNDVWGSSGNNVFAVGGGTILRYDGTKWAEMQDTDTDRLNCLWGNAADDVFAAGASYDEGTKDWYGTILHYDGTAWTEMMTSTSPSEYYGIWGSSGNNMYAVGYDAGLNGVMLRYDGSSWANTAEYPSGTLNVIWGSSAKDAFAFAHNDSGNGSFFHYEGTEWTSLIRADDLIEGMWGNSGSDVFAVGRHGTIFRYDGTSWAEVSSGTGSSLYDVWGTSEGDVFAVGDAGTILRLGEGDENPPDQQDPDDTSVETVNLQDQDGNTYEITGVNSVIENIALQNDPDESLTDFVSSDQTALVSGFIKLGAKDGCSQSDINCDGRVDMADAVLGLQVCSGIRLNGDGTVTLQDVVYILQVATGFSCQNTFVETKVKFSEPPDRIIVYDRSTGEAEYRPFYNTEDGETLIRFKTDEDVSFLPVIDKTSKRYVRDSSKDFDKPFNIEVNDGNTLAIKLDMGTWLSVTCCLYINNSDVAEKCWSDISNDEKITYSPKVSGVYSFVVKDKLQIPIWKQDVLVQTDSDFSDADIEALANKYAPILAYNEGEEYSPSSLTRIFEGSKKREGLLTRLFTILGGDSVAFADLKDYMPYNGHSEYMMIPDGDTKSHLEGKKWNPEDATVYYSFLKDGGKYYLNYHFFYPYDKKADSGWFSSFNHAFDRESMTLEFGSDLEEPPNAVVYSYHIPGQEITFASSNESLGKAGRVRLKWDDAYICHGHPIICIAKGSHALYPVCGNYKVIQGVESRWTAKEENAGGKKLLIPSSSSGDFPNGLETYKPKFLDLAHISSNTEADNEYVGYLAFSGDWINTLIVSGHNFPPFTDREKSPSVWVNGAATWYPNRVPQSSINLMKSLRDLLECNEEPGIVTVSPESGTWNASPQWADVSCPGAEKIYCTIRTATDGSTPEDPPEPTAESHDIFNQNEDEYIAGASGKFEIWAESGQVKHLKVRFRGYNNGVYGPASKVYSYTISSGQNTPGIVTVSPESGTWNASPQWADVSCPGAERIYCTIRTATDGSMPEDPPEPTVESHDIFNRNEDEFIAGSSGEFQIWAEPGEFKNLKVRFRGYNNGVYGPASKVYFYTINRGDTQLETYTNSLGMTFVLIPAGTFMMGSPEDEPGRHSDETLHQVTLTKSYYMQTTEVTQGQWKALMGSNPSSFDECGDNCPVEYVSWNDVQEFITELNKRGEGTYRLPTEAEWEYAARAGSSTAFANGDITETGNGYDPNLDAMGWYFGNSRYIIHPVGLKQPNAWGLYDMHGNTWEWCQDIYNVDIYKSDQTDPIYIGEGSNRVIRGGGWNGYAQYCRSAYRDDSSPDARYGSVGFRLMRTP
jgi:formylglycine-generating enzyme required for sulfatase activity